MGQFRHQHSGKTRTMALFWLRTSYHAQRYMFQRYMVRSLLTQSSNIVNTPIILLFSKKWVPGFAAEDNTNRHMDGQILTAPPCNAPIYVHDAHLGFRAESRHVMPRFCNLRILQVHRKQKIWKEREDKEGGDEKDEYHCL